jgi:hypothetical protein|nr:PcfJ domain-containing protein [Neorhizobium tomejilense]
MALEQDSEIVDFLATFSEDADVLRLMYHCVGRVLLKIKNSRRNWREAGLAVDLKHAADWLGVALHHGEDWLSNVDEHGRPKKLLKFSDLDGILKEANKAMIKRAMQTPVIKIDEGEEVLEQVLDAGWYMVRLLTSRALDNESAVMQHCVGHGTYDEAVRENRKVILSLRDPHNNPHVTIEVDVASNSVVQIRGKQNAKPKAEYARRVRNFINGRDYDSVYRPVDVGIVIDEMGRRFGVDQLPAGLAIKGTLDLSGYELTELPEFLEIRGDLKIERSAIRTLPRGLKVTGSLLAAKSKLEALPLDHGIARDIDVSGSKIAALPDGLEVDGNLNLSDTDIVSLPRNLVVTGDLNLEAADLKVYPSGVLVGRNIFLSGSSVRRFEDRNLYVGGSLLMNDCGRVHMPEHLSVEYSVFIEKTVIASGAKVFEVGRTLYCHQSDFTAEGRRFKVGRGVRHRHQANEGDIQRVMREAEGQIDRFAGR